VKRVLPAFVIGALFAVGLLLAGMTRPERVIGFLDVGGAWDPTLAFVMAGAIAVHVLGLRLVLPAPTSTPASSSAPACSASAGASAATARGRPWSRSAPAAPPPWSSSVRRASA
jgi:uncharacterized membrane protein YedE/YeeE